MFLLHDALESQMQEANKKGPKHQEAKAPSVEMERRCELRGVDETGRGGLCSSVMDVHTVDQSV